MSAGVSIYIAVKEDGRYVAATNESPYFCLEAESEEALIEKVKAALVFYSSTLGQEVRSRTVVQSITQLVPSRVIESEDLAISA